MLIAKKDGWINEEEMAGQTIAVYLWNDETNKPITGSVYIYTPSAYNYEKEKYSLLSIEWRYSQEEGWEWARYLQDWDFYGESYFEVDTSHLDLSSLDLVEVYEIVTQAVLGE